MEKTLLEWKASGFKTASPTKAVFIFGSIFFILTATAGIFGFLVAIFFAILEGIPKKCKITDKKIQWWFKKSDWNEVKRCVWDGPRLRVYRSRRKFFVLPVKEKDIRKVKSILSEKRF